MLLLFLNLLPPLIVILQRLETLGYQRDATVIRKREEEDKKKKEKIAEEKKKEQKAKDEAQVLAEEAEIAKKELENGNGTLEEVNLFGDEESTESTNSQNEKKSNVEQQKVSEKQQLFNQIIGWLKKIGIPVHNKTEMEAFLKEHGVDDVETLFDKEQRNVLDKIPILHIENSSEYGTFIENAFQNQDRIKNGIGWANTADNYYIYDLDANGFTVPKIKIPINDTVSQRIFAILNSGRTLSESDERSLESLGVNGLHEGLQQPRVRLLLSDIAKYSRSNSTIHELDSSEARRQGTNISSTTTASNSNSKAYRRESARITREIGMIVLNAKKKGTLFKAPNGKPTNLSPQQWIMVRTKNFKEWFGDWENDPKNASKVVDENGEPKVVYHSRERDDLDFYEGTLAYFSTFKQNQYGKNVIPAFLDIRKPLYKGAGDLSSKSYEELQDELEENGADGYISTDTGNLIVASQPTQIKSAADDTLKSNNGRYSSENLNIQELRTPDGELYGFVYNGEIYIDETKLSPEVAIHEYTHLWDKAVMKIKPELWNRGKELMKELRLWDQILQDENYGRKWKAQGKTEEEIEDLIASEVHARLTGEEGEKVLLQIAKEQGNQNIISKVKKWLLDVWKTLKSTFDSSMTQEELDKLTLKDFIHMTVRDLVGGINPNTVADNTETVENNTEDIQKIIDLEGHTIHIFRNDDGSIDFKHQVVTKKGNTGYDSNSGIANSLTLKEIEENGLPNDISYIRIKKYRGVNKDGQYVYDIVFKVDNEHDAATIKTNRPLTGFENSRTQQPETLHLDLDNPEASATENVEGTKGVENSAKHSTNTAVAPAQGNVIDNGDIVQIETPTLEQQVANNGDLNSAIQNINSAKNADEQNVKNKNISSTLSGNAMSEWQMEPLITEGKLVHKQGKEPTDAMSTYYSWLDAAGIKLQNIIDQELGIILKNNPHAKVKFMSVQQQYNATHDNYTKEKLFLVLDFDDTVNEDITKIHNNKNGGVIESNGKKYLIIGVAGYGNGKNREKQELYNILFGANPHSITGLGIIKKGQKDFFDAHPNERFYVNDVISTEIVPQSLIPGYRVKQQEEDDNATYRKLSDLLHDKDRNPQEYELEDLGFGIQKGEYYSVVNAKVENVMPPSSPETNIGRVFVLIPAGNGKLMPAYIKPLFYRELKDCKLKKDIDSLLEGLIAPSYAERYQAYLDLCQYLHLTKEGHSFLLRKKSQEISLVKNGIVFKTFVLNESFNRQEFFDAIMDMNPRISITENTLRSRTLLKEYDEAGALMTDIAQLGTAGSSYDIFAVDGDGRMIEPTSNVHEKKQQQSNLSELRRANTIQIPYNGEFYIGTNGSFTLNSEVITDEAIIEQLRYNEQIIRGHIAPTSIKGIYGWYILSTNKDNPIVVKVNNNTHEVKVLDKATADIYIDHIQKEKQEVERKEAAQDKLQEENNAENASLVSIEEVDLGLTEEDDERIDLKELEIMNLEEVDLGLDEKTESSDINKSSVTVESNTESKKTVEKEPNKQPIVDIFEKNRGVSTEELLRRQRHEGQQTLTFLEVLKDRRYMKRLVNIIYSKWKDAPKMLDALSQFLKEKNIEVDSIPNTEEDIETWIETLEDCR